MRTSGIGSKGTVRPFFRSLTPSRLARPSIPIKTTTTSATMTPATTPVKPGNKKSKPPKGILKKKTTSFDIQDLENKKTLLYRQLLASDYVKRRVGPNMDLLGFYGDAHDTSFEKQADQFCMKCFVQKRKDKTAILDKNDMCFEKWHEYEKKYHGLLDEIRQIDNEIYNIKYAAEHGIQQTPEQASKMDYYMTRLFRQFFY